MILPVICSFEWEWDKIVAIIQKPNKAARFDSDPHTAPFGVIKTPLHKPPSLAAG
jgi:hypothetical protein